MKKYSLILIMFTFILLITGCSQSKNEITSNNEKIDTSKMLHKHCTRKGNAGDGVEVNLNYDIYYTGDSLNLIHSIEQVKTTNEDTLNTYEEAYKKIHERYKDVEYYDTNIVREDGSVTSDMTINYDKVNIDHLIAIEGEKDNIFENKKAKLSKWMKLAKKVGTECEDVEE